MWRSGATQENKAIDNSNTIFTTYKSTPTSNFANTMYKYLPDSEEDDDVTIVTNRKI